MDYETMEALSLLCSYLPRDEAIQFGTSPLMEDELQRVTVDEITGNKTKIEVKFKSGIERTKIIDTPISVYKSYK